VVSVKAVSRLPSLVSVAKRLKKGVNTGWRGDDESASHPWEL